jgi:hypothetical protein
LSAALIGWLGCGDDETTAPVQTTSSGTTTTTSTGSGMCDAVPTAPGSGNCPQACTGGCTSEHCIIDCAAGGCSGTTLACPPDYSCQVLCTGADACDGATVNCPPTYACSVACSGGTDACGDVSLSCTDGPCEVACSTDACQGMTVQCGTGECSATCAGMPTPTLACGGACICAPC